MPAGEAFSERQQQDVVRAIRLAQQQSQLPVSVYVGTLEGDSRATALQLHGALGDDAPQTVLVAVDPGARRVEVVTGSEVRRRLDDRGCRPGRDDHDVGLPGRRPLGRHRQRRARARRARPRPALAAHRHALDERPGAARTSDRRPYPPSRLATQPGPASRK